MPSSPDRLVALCYPELPHHCYLHPLLPLATSKALFPLYVFQKILLTILIVENRGMYNLNLHLPRVIPLFIFLQVSIAQSDLSKSVLEFFPHPASICCSSFTLVLPTALGTALLLYPLCLGL